MTFAITLRFLNNQKKGELILQYKNLSNKKYEPRIEICQLENNTYLTKLL